MIPLVALQRGLHVQQEMLKDQVVVNVIWDSKLRSRGALQRCRALQELCEIQLASPCHGLHHERCTPNGKG